MFLQIASRSMLVKEVVALEQGSIIEFPRSADQDLEILRAMTILQTCHIEESIRSSEQAQVQLWDILTHRVKRRHSALHTILCNQ